MTSDVGHEETVYSEQLDNVPSLPGRSPRCPRWIEKISMPWA